MVMAVAPPTSSAVAPVVPPIGEPAVINETVVMDMVHTVLNMPPPAVQTLSSGLYSDGSSHHANFPPHYANFPEPSSPTISPRGACTKPLHDPNSSHKTNCDRLLSAATRAYEEHLRAHPPKQTTLGDFQEHHIERRAELAARLEFARQIVVDRAAHARKLREWDADPTTRRINCGPGCNAHTAAECLQICPRYEASRRDHPPKRLCTTSDRATLRSSRWDDIDVD